jgi:hypothetical protein
MSTSRKGFTVGYHRSSSVRPSRSPVASAFDRANRARRALARAAASAAPTRGGRRRALFALEPIEARRLLAVTWSFEIEDPGDTYAEWHDEVLDMMEASTGAWSDIFSESADASIEVLVRIEDDGPFGFLASAGPVELEKVRTSGGVDIVEGGPTHEIRTGFDPNGAVEDAVVTWNAHFLESGEIFTSTSSGRDVPAFAYDGVTVATHELGHVLGILGLRNSFTGDVEYINPDTGQLTMSTFDELVEQRSGRLYFIGGNARSVYGGRVGIYQGAPGSGGSHYGGPGSPDLDDNLMSFSAEPGVILDITLIDEAILADIGLPVDRDFPEPEPPSGPVLTVNGTAGDDVITVTLTGSVYVVTVNGVTDSTSYDADDYGRVLVDAGAGNDRVTINGAVRATTINGGAGNDTLVGGGGDDSLTGGDGVDRLVGNGGRDRLDGGGGKDFLFGGDGLDVLFGGNSGDYLEGGNGSDSIFGGTGNDEIIAGGGSDTIFGEEGDDMISGGSGNDSMIGGLGADRLFGGDDRDIVDYSDRVASVILSLNGAADDGEAGEGDFLELDVEVLIGGAGDDRMQGGGQSMYLIGGEGRDTLAGGGRADTLEGNAGGDKLIGNGGADVIVGNGGNDYIIGGSGSDRIRGGAGADRIFAADRSLDMIAGGDGDDVAEIDQRDTELEAIEELIEINVA